MSVLERVSLLNSYNTLLNDDSDFSRFEQRLTNFGSGVLFSDMTTKPEFDISGTSGTATITSGEAIITTTRATSSPITGKKTPVRYQLSDTKTLTGLVSGSKIYIEIDQTLVDNPTLIQDTYPSTDYSNGLNIGTLTHATSRPATNTYIPLWELSGVDWTWTDLRDMPKIKGNRIDFVDVDGNISTEGNITAQDIRALGDMNATSSYANEFYTPNGGVQEQINTINTSLGITSALSNEDYLAGESIIKGDSLFVEDMVTFAEVDQSQLIGDVAGNKRVSARAIGSGVAGNTLKLSLAKIVSPSVDLGIRIETDNAGVPSGTLVDANATATIASGDLTTDLADTTITLTDTITIAKGTVVHIVLFQGTYGSETVNAINHYKIGYANINTTTRFGKCYDGTNWNLTTLAANVESGNVYTSYAGTTNSLSCTFVPKYNIYITTISVPNGATSVAITGLGISKTVTGTGPYTFNSYFEKGITYSMVVAGTGMQYGSRLTKTETNMTFDIGISFTFTINSAVCSILPNAMIYTDSDLFEDTLYSKTDARYTYKLPDIPRIVDKAYSAGEIPKRDFKGITKHLTGLTKGTELFVSNTPGALSTTAGNNHRIIGTAKDADELYIDDDGYLGGTALTDATTTYTVPSGTRVILVKVLSDGPNTAGFTGADMILTKVKTTSRMVASDSNGQNNQPDITASWSGSSLTITKVKSTTLSGNIYYYKHL